jgi:hypothetical protein
MTRPLPPDFCESGSTEDSLWDWFCSPAIPSDSTHKSNHTHISYHQLMFFGFCKHNSTISPWKLHPIFGPVHVWLAKFSSQRSSWQKIVRDDHAAGHLYGAEIALKGVSEIRVKPQSGAFVWIDRLIYVVFFSWNWNKYEQNDILLRICFFFPRIFSTATVELFCSSSGIPEQSQVLFWPCSCVFLCCPKKRCSAQPLIFLFRPSGEHQKKGETTHFAMYFC